MWSRRELKDRAKTGLKRNYWKSVLIGFLVSLMYAAGAASGREGLDGETVSTTITGLTTGEILAALGVLLGSCLAASLATAVIHAIIYNPLKVGISQFCMDAVDGDAKIAAIGSGYKPDFFANVWALLLRDLFVVLWGLLLVIPGVIKSYEYRLTEYVLAENPGIGPKEAMARSKSLMQGNKWSTFVLDLSFLGWDILNVLTVGILGTFYVQPYKLLTNAALYEKLKETN